jgi:hypothetical protein
VSGARLADSPDKADVSGSSPHTPTHLTSLFASPQQPTRPTATSTHLESLPKSPSIIVAPVWITGPSWRR